MRSVQSTIQVIIQPTDQNNFIESQDLSLKSYIFFLIFITFCFLSGCGVTNASESLVNESDKEVAVVGTEDTSTCETDALENILSTTNIATGDFTQLDLENNPFWDALVYTGYNIEKHIADGEMWHYRLAAEKRDKGWLSNITYAGGSLGYETNAKDEPDIEFFEKNGLVCASYVTYVYYNYLPNIAGVDTSLLPKPERSYNANDWYISALKWVEEGYSEIIEFDAEITKSGFIRFYPEYEIPIGSILAFCDGKNISDHCSHIVIYAGYENNYHWVYHVGNENGPEFCAVERMNFGPDPQWPIKIITTPKIVWESIH